MDAKRYLRIVAAGIALGSTGCTSWGANKGPIVPQAPKPPAVPERSTSITRSNLMDPEFDLPANPTPEGYVMMANFYTGAGRAGLALNLYEKALKLDPKFIAAYVGLSQYYVAQKDEDNASKTLRRGLAVDPNSALLWNEVAVMRARRGDLPGAIEAEQRALNREPNSAALLKNLGGFLLAAGDYERAIQCLSKAINPAEAHYRVAGALYKARDMANCVHELEVAVGCDPHHEGAVKMLGQLTSDRGSQVVPAAAQMQEQ